MKKLNHRKLKGIASAVVLSALFLIACDDTYIVNPQVLTLQVADTGVTATTARLRGQIQILGTRQILRHGFEVYKNSLTSTPIDTGVTTLATTDTFTIVVTGLQPQTLYYYWAYARVNSTNVHSGSALQFTTKQVK